MPHGGLISSDTQLLTEAVDAADRRDTLPGSELLQAIRRS